MILGFIWTWNAEVLKVPHKPAPNSYSNYYDMKLMGFFSQV